VFDYLFDSTGGRPTNTALLEIPLLTKINGLYTMQHSFSAFPNPADDFIFIKSNENTENAELFIENVLGKNLIKLILGNLTKGSITPVNINLPPSIYVLKIVSGAQVSTCKIVVN
jgi:hypothetical protein